MKSIMAGMLIWLGAVAPAMAEDAGRYIDDRSDAPSLIASYYNAVNRHEYARAWSYWDTPPAGQTYEDFVDGYAGTETVRLYTGEALSEGAAGSIYHSLAVAIESAQTDGTVAVYAGCFTLRLAQPTIQEPPFMPLHIESASLVPVDPPAERAVPETCME